MLHEDVSIGNELLEQLTRLSTRHFSGAENEEQEFGELLNVTTAKVRDSWAFAVFSNAGSVSLRRYFDYQITYLAGLLKTRLEVIADGCSCDAKQPASHFQAAVCELIDFAMEFYQNFIDPLVQPGLVYQKHFIKGFSPYTHQLLVSIKCHAHPGPIQVCLRDYLEELLGEAPRMLTVAQLQYFSTFVQEMHFITSLDDVVAFNKQLEEKVLELEFNHFGIFAAMQQALRTSCPGKSRSRKLLLIDSKLAYFEFKSKGEVARYDDRWPPLTGMLADWLKLEKERYSHSKTAAVQIQRPTSSIKLQLQLSVAHLAFLIRLFSKENIFGLVPVTDIFSFFSANFSTKRQESLSIGGLSKEYYTKNLVTAVEVRALLTKMIAQINRDYFPAWVVIGTAIFGLSER